MPSTERPDVRLDREVLGTDVVLWKIDVPGSGLTITDAEMNELLLQHALASKHQGRYYSRRRGARA